MLVRYFKTYHYLFFWIGMIFFLIQSVAISGQPVRKDTDISGKWYSNLQVSYQITQQGDSFYWVDSQVGNKVWGTIAGENLTVNWTDRTGQHSLTGKITGYDSSGWPIKIQWSNGMIFQRQGKTPMITPVKGWCCKDGQVISTTITECRNRSGHFFNTQKEAEQFCRGEREQPRPEEHGWCCREGEIFRSSIQECEERQGRFFHSQREAEQFCREEQEQPRPEEHGWCCREGEIFRSSIQECEERQGRFFHSQREAEQFCRGEREQPRPEEHGWCCHEGEVFRCSLAQCEERGGQFFPSREQAEECARQMQPGPKGEDQHEPEPPPEIRDEVHFVHPEYSIFSEYALPLEEYEIREKDVNTPEGIKKIRYIYVSAEELRRKDLDPPVTDYPEGVSIIDGDIIVDLSRPAGVENHAQYGQLGAGGSPFLMMAMLSATGTSDWKTLWPKRVVPYVIAPLAQQYDGGQILTAMSYFAAAGIKFRPRKPEDGNCYMYFMKTSDWYSGSSDGIGMDPAGGPRTIKIGYHVSTGLIAHEIGHGLGLFHEQQRSDRDKYVDIFWGNIKTDHLSDYCQYKVTSPTQWCISQNRGGKDIGYYDYGSIMHYGSYTFGKVSATKVFLGGLACIAAPFLPDCYKSKTYTMRTMQRKDQSTITANRSVPSQKDINALIDMYKNADKCGCMQSGTGYGVVKFGGTNTFNHEVDYCTNRLYNANTTDYMTLVINIDSLNVDIPAKEFVVDLKTPRPQGGFDIITATNPAGNTKKITLTRKLLPGPHTLKITNWLFKKVKYRMWFKLTQTQLPVDPWDMNNKGNTPETAIGLGILSSSPLVNKVLSLATLHHPNDIDYYAFRLPPLPSWAIEQYCDKTTGPHGAKIIPGNFTIQIERNDLNRVLRTVVYTTDAQGKLIHDVNKAFRPWGWGTKKQVITNPYKHFKQGRVIFSVEDCSDAQGQSKVFTGGKCGKNRRHYYKLRITFSFTAEEQIPKQLPSLDMLPEVAQYGPIPEHLTPNAIELIINQGQEFMQVLPVQLKTRYGFDRLMDSANRLAADTMTPGNLSTQYQQFFIEKNRMQEIK
jgi:hypothetical protein